MGAGKSTVGKLLAKKLGRQFIDVDHVIEERCGVKIPLIFEMEGEAGFRKREAQALDHASLGTGIVLATGGGAVLLPENRQLLRERGTVVYLHANPVELWHRTKGSDARPLLKNGDPRKILEELYTFRDPLYREIADHIIETGKPSVNQLVHTLMMQLELS
ncbi:shikimate kinase [Polynucleobacter sp. MWH-P3-07-1]|jgi:shikimate kinase|uniref:shikimate kinase n=1 Tax=Polynucleobacter sp. MWH-P3-07-1 TaxID=1743173 RepID=UPI001BFD04EC|nr:shikimate kinase [Polynucleobacter sp. MWH-P3-07-1]QWD84318.1 shikimate kinase [Polynucleobacter sp. MWH-P3-07-1]QWD93534.1 shikimate kinase [Polynucleobacter asymbioticus]